MSGFPGTGLLIMRLVTGLVLIARGSEGLVGDPSPGPAVASFARIVLGLLMIGGLWTPVAGVFVAIVEIGSFVARSDDLWLHLFPATLGIALALLGPGSWSIDSRLFGWQRIDIDTRDRRDRR